jgi:DNA polymerase theta
VYCAPTSGGKSLVADLICLRSALKPEWADSKVLIVLPFISLVSEKVRELKAIITGYNRGCNESEKVRIKALYGDQGFPLKNRKALDGRMIIICTIEKSSSVVNTLMQQQRIKALKLVAIDEMHLLQDPSRGYMLEILVSKLKFIAKRAEASLHPVRIQTIALSATIGNIRVVASWFGASLYVTQFRPVPLHEYIKAGNDILSPSGAGMWANRNCN